VVYGDASGTSMNTTGYSDYQVIGNYFASRRAKAMQIDKDKDRRRTRMSDVLGYLIWQKDRSGTIGERGERLF